MDKCTVSQKCGGCAYQGTPYNIQLELKQKLVTNLLGKYCRILPIEGMDNPYYYRNKVHHALLRDRQGNVASGIYEPSSHKIAVTDDCLLEDKKSQEIISSICSLVRSFGIPVYNEFNSTGLLRHILVRRGFRTGEIMVILVSASSVLPSKNNFLRALLELHPEITTVVLNVNDRRTPMVLGEKNITLFGKGFIYDILCGLKYMISPDSFYQVNPVQTEKLYDTAMDFADLTGTETVLDAYCGIGTIGLAASSKAANVIGVELNKNAVADARYNCRNNKITNAKFFQGDAGDFMADFSASGGKLDVLFMDPPRAGSTPKFISSAVKASPKKIVYVSCCPETLARDLALFVGSGYRAVKIKPVDMFPFTEHAECVVCLRRK